MPKNLYFVLLDTKKPRHSHARAFKNIIYYGEKKLESSIIYFPRLQADPKQQQNESNTSGALQGLLPPCEFSRHFDFDRVGVGNGVVRGNVCRVMDLLLHILSSPSVALHIDCLTYCPLMNVDAVVKEDAVPCVALVTQRVGSNRLDYHRPCLASGKQQYEHHESEPKHNGRQAAL